MSKELEALKELRAFNNCDIHEPRMEEKLLVIEQAFERKENLEKAFEIIKKFAKSINIKYIFVSDLVIIILGGDEFEWQYKCKNQEEYNLLKEVLEQ